MANKITIQADTERVQKRLEQLRKDAGAVDKPMAEIGRKLQTLIQVGFKTSRSPYGLPWAKLSVRDGKPLLDTGRLRSSINYRVGKNGEAYHVDVGTNVQYADMHQYGETIYPVKGQYLRFKGAHGFIFAKSVTIPARPFMPLKGEQLALPDPWKRSVLQAVESHLDRVTQ